MATNYFIIPAYNEAGNIGGLLQSLLDLASEMPVSVILVNDGSVDGTLAEAAKFQQRLDLRIVNHTLNQGVPQTFYDGLALAAACSEDSDCIFIIEGDGTSDLSLAREMSRRIESGDDVVVASRYIRGGAYLNFPRHRTWGSRFVNAILKTTCRIPGITDYTIFYRSYRAAVIKRAIEQHGRDLVTGRSFAANLAILLRIEPYCRNISEVPLRYDYGLKKSSSKMNLFGTLREYQGLIIERLSGRRAHQKDRKSVDVADDSRMSVAWEGNAGKRRNANESQATTGDYQSAEANHTMENDQTKQNHPDDPLPPLNIPWRLPKRQGLLLFLIASAATSLFYGESLVLGSLNAGFVYTLDSWHACVAHLAKLSFLVSQGTFTGIDFSTHGGASEFFLRPNLYPYHPFVLLYCFLRHPDTPEQLIRLSVLLLFAHSWVGCYFALRLCLRYLNRGIGFAVFVALGYTFSVQMVNALAYPPYVFCASMVPWAIYGGLSVSGNIFPGRIIRHSLPIFIMLTGGYVAIGVSCVALSAGFILVYILYVEGPEQYWRAKVGRLLAAYLPFGLAGLVVAPLYWAILVFHSKVPTASTSLYWSAQMLSEVPSSVLRLLSTHTNYEGPFYEFSLVWGFIPVAIVVLFFAGFRDQEELSGFGWRLLKFAGAIYVLFALAIYGKYSAVSDLLFAVPGIGKMHIYQRHLLAGHFFFVIAVGLMLGAVARRGPSLSTKVMLFVLVGMMAISAHLVATNSPAVESLRLNNYLVVELMLGALFAASLFFPGRWMSFVTATFLILLISLNQIYGFSSDPQWSYPVQQTKEISLDKANNLHVLAYFRSQSHKKIVKYLDLVPGVRGYFSKNYPWFVAKDLALSSYGGYEFQLAARADYLQRMNTTMRPGDTDLVLLPDWRWAEQTGAEFVIFQQGYGMNDPHLGEVAELGDPSRVLTLPNNIVIAPLRFRRSGFGTASVGGRFVRIQLSGTNNLTLAEVRVMSPRGGVVSNVAQGKPASQSSTPASLAGAAGRAVDGNTNGDFNAGSVTHTDADPNAWWQVDLGSSVAIDSIEIWNRTDCCGFRLDDFWVFVSDTPFAPSDTPATLEKRARTFSTHQTGRPSPSISIAGTQARESAIYDNGYLRVIGNEDGGTAKGFRTDGAATLELDVDAQKPVKVQYLFWPNDRLEFFLDGLPVASTLVDGMQTVAIPPGHKHLEIRYVNWPLRFFLLFYALYALAYIGALAAPVLRVSRLRLLRVMTV